MATREHPATAGPAVAHERTRRAPLQELGEVGAFSGRALLELRGVWVHFAEILRQCAILLLGTTVIASLMVMVGGAECTTLGIYFFRTIGAESFAGAFTNVCGTRTWLPLLFSYIFAAKVGCGLVAEIGSMKISEEIEALESVGIDPIRYVVGTRIAAAIIALPIFTVIGLAFTALGGFLTAQFVGGVSQGAFEASFWGTQNALTNLFVVIKVFAIGLAVVLVSSFYGLTARGGPEGVGRATAKSMAVNIVLIHFLDAMGTTLFFGSDVRVGLGG